MITDRTKRSPQAVVSAMAMSAVLSLALSTETFAQPAGVEEGQIAYFVLLDDSDSMKHPPKNPTAEKWSPKIEEVKLQMKSFVASLPNGTKVRFYAFSKDLTRGPQVEVASAADRKQLTDFVGGLRAEGKETRLWRCLDVVLGEAAKEAEGAPGRRVRVLAYTDGEDNEQPPTPPETVLGKYKEQLRESQVQLTYVSIGFELQGKQLAELERQGVQVRTALSPAEVIPLQAEFRAAPEVVLPGERLVIMDDSIGLIRDRDVDWGDGSPPSQGRSPWHVYEKPGEYAIRLTVTSPAQQKSSMTRKIRVVLPPAPAAKFNISAERVATGAPVLLVSESRGSRLQTAWDFGDGRTSTETNPQPVWSASGEFTIRLTVTDLFGRSDSAERTLRVEGPKPPSAAIFAPPRAALGERIPLIDRSTGDIIRFVWCSDGREIATERDCFGVFTEVGPHRVTLKVVGPGGTSQAEHLIEVTGPAKPLADLYVPEAVELGSTATLVDRSTNLVQSRKWLVDGVAISTERDARHLFATEGEHEVALEVRGPGGVDVATRKVAVTAPPPPTADFVIGAPAPYAGEVVVLTDASIGATHKAVWHLPGREGPLVVDYDRGGSRSIEYAFPTAGAHQVRLQVQGKGGEADVRRNLQISTRLSPPVPVVTSSVVESGRDFQVIRFQNRSQGSVSETEYDFGDGTPPFVAQGVRDANHQYAPGKYVAQVRVVGPPEFAAAIVDIPLVIPRPWPAWTAHLKWFVPAASTLLAVFVVATRVLRKRRENRRLSMLVGTLNYKPKGDPLAPYASVEFSGTASEERVLLGGSMQAIVRAACDPLTNQIEHFVELVDGAGTHYGPVPLPQNDRTTVGDYEFNLVQI